MNSMDWWPWWITTLIGAAVAAIAVAVVLKARARLLRRSSIALGAVALAAAIAAPFVMGSSNPSGMMASSSGSKATGKIVFVRDGALLAVRADTGRLTRIGNGSLVNPANDPEWSPDGKSIVFTRGCGLVVTRSDGSDTRKISIPGSACAKHPTWSPDGKQIAFVAQLGSAQSPVFAVHSDGTGLRQLTQNKGATGEFEDRYPAWSPDGSAIAFARLRPGMAPDMALYAMNADGTNLRLIRPDRGSTLENMPVWSPDGRWLAYGRLGRVPLTTRIDMMTIYVASVDGKTHKRVSRVAMGDGDMYPAWSPDGSMVAFMSGGGGIGVMKADGTERRMLTRRWGDAMPDWSTKGQ